MLLKSHATCAADKMTIIQLVHQILVELQLELSSKLHGTFGALDHILRLSVTLSVMTPGAGFLTVVFSA